MKELLQALTAADSVCRQANPYFERAAELEQQCEARKASLKKARTKWIIIGVVVWMIGGGLLGQIPVLGKIAGIIFAGLALYVGGSGFKRDKEKVNADIAEMEKEIEKTKASGQQIFDQYIDEMAFLPVDYWYPMATEYLVKAVQAKRASTLGEAIDKFEEQLHRWRIEEANTQMIALQQQQTAHLASIKTSSKISAAANVTNTIFNIANHL